MIKNLLKLSEPIFKTTTCICKFQSSSIRAIKILFLIKKCFFQPLENDTVIHLLNIMLNDKNNINYTDKNRNYENSKTTTNAATINGVENDEDVNNIFTDNKLTNKRNNKHESDKNSSIQGVNLKKKFNF